MSTTIDSDLQAQTEKQGRLPSGERRSRGNLELDRRVVEKIAAQAAREVPTAGGKSGGVLGIGAHADTSALPKVEVDLTGRTARVAVEVALAYPTALAESAEQVRTHVMTRVAQLTGVQVSRVDVSITALSRPQHAGRSLR